MKELLEVLRVQRHNFLNHLQVISGLLQLKKHDRIMEYITQIGNDYNQDSLVGRLEVPEITAAILSSDLKAGKQGITINKKITTGLERGIANADDAAEIFKAMLNAAISLMEKMGYCERKIGLEITEEPAKYVFSVNIPGTGLEENFGNEITSIKRKVLALNAEVESETGNGLINLTLKIPVSENNTDK